MSKELLIPDEHAKKLEVLIGMATAGIDSPHTKRAYKRDMEDFLEWYRTEKLSQLNKAAVGKYKDWMLETGRGQTAVNRALSAVRRFLREAADNDLIDAKLAEGATRVKGVKTPGTRSGNWLTIDEVSQLINAPDKDTLKGKRDRALLSLLVGCGLRREELSELTIGHIQQREGRWVIVDIRGKRNKVRTVPMAAWVKVIIDQWTTAAGITGENGRIMAQVSRGKDGKILKPITTTQAIYRAVQKYAEMIHRPEIAPHDLRRTYAKLARSAGAPLEQIQITLGHESLAVTQKYLGSEIDYQNAPSDYIKPSIHMR
jgi:site-specific recombinase XerD